jgi:hypothetical protein
MSGVIKMGPKRSPMPSSGTFSSNGYGLDQPTPVVSYAPRAVVARPPPAPALNPRLQMPSWLLEQQAYGDIEQTVSASRKAGIGVVAVGGLVLGLGLWAYQRSKTVGG